MFRRSSPVVFMSVWICLACSTAKPDQEPTAAKEQQPVAGKTGEPTATAEEQVVAEKPLTPEQIKEQQLVGEKYITNLINNEYQKAYEAFTPKISKKFSFALFERVMKKNQDRYGRPLSFAYKGESEDVVNVTPDLEKASKSHLYNVVLEKEEKKQTETLVLTFGIGDISNRLVTFKYLTDENTPSGDKKK